MTPNESKTLKSLGEMTQEEVDALNEQTRAELAESVEEYEVNKTAQVSSAIQTLINVTESETHKVEFSGPAGSCTLEIMAAPPQKLIQELFKIGGKSGDSQEVSTKDEDRLCRILEYICIEPKISYEVWKSGELSDELIATIIFELMKRKVTKHKEMVTEIESFQPDKRGAKNPGNMRGTKTGTK